MGAETTGRKLGIGMRLFARAVHQGAAAASAASRSPQTPKPSSASPSNYTSSASFAAPAKQVKTRAAGVAHGAKRFGEAIWAPMAHTGGVLWLEITGLFFGLFALFFAQNVYKFRQNYAGGPEHTHFLVYAALTVLFTAFTITQFYKAHRKDKTNRARMAAVK